MLTRPDVPRAERQMRELVTLWERAGRRVADMHLNVKALGHCYLPDVACLLAEIDRLRDLAAQAGLLERRADGPAQGPPGVERRALQAAFVRG